MSYLDQSRRRNPTSVAAVVGVHLAVGYALLIGLGYTPIPRIHGDTTIFDVKDVPPPPPLKDEVKQRAKQTTDLAQPQPKTAENLKVDDQIIKVPDFGDTSGTAEGGGGPVVMPKVEPARPSQAADAIPGKDRLRWITNDDYPAGLIRQNVQGVVAISVMIGVDGQVRSCLVTQSSGNKQLDDTTCRLYTKRAHFTPARDSDGNPTMAQRSDRFRWQIPNE